MSFQRPTPRTDAHAEKMHRHEFDEELALTYQLARDIERDCDSAKDLNRELLTKLEAMQAERDEMRQAIKEFSELARWLAANSSGLPYRTANAIVARSRPFIAECGQYADKHLAPAPSSTPADTLKPLQNQGDSVVSPAGIEPATT